MRARWCVCCYVAAWIDAEGRIPMEEFLTSWHKNSWDQAPTRCTLTQQPTLPPKGTTNHSTLMQMYVCVHVCWSPWMHIEYLYDVCICRLCLHWKTPHSTTTFLSYSAHMPTPRTEVASNVSLYVSSWGTRTCLNVSHDVELYSQFVQTDGFENKVQPVYTCIRCTIQ